MIIKKTKKIGRDKKLTSSHSFTIWQSEIRNRGYKVKYDYISMNGYTESVMLVPITKDKKIILIEKFCTANNKFEFVLPGGKIEKGDNLSHTAQKELVEETGYEAEKLIFLCSLDILPAYFVGRTHGFLAINIKESNEFARDNEESVRIIKLSLKKALFYINSGGISDARTIALILYFNTFALHENYSLLHPKSKVF
ncbi:hypothetical protein A3D00_04915 [Candidatus Woesebacteria bacterium RIFCSPHIGHO2_02_FULL_38_9]|uniref:Nudix hydrolase domain-containing protein n=1 Tax=Candidatus Woesebacteria bacterium RIFCSPHIGHO2_01_FULL_39_28 TaxID=1802496 RepID=A0A1F7YA04_9BACT|nr:MAG: hypothetical protein A2627_03565 [Candidatus Woesebacteria bacterium RIFCSPHIGHO2_01_FULL_39_28]OGM34989.1 MAG: hypothetical protein A3D00_04915 [Candidatus Woesebacteria bacterium RIFCSPHIGHO2_02_FULL_38_9]OGM57425.1 MAG: hypothetical protein A3A50_05840 [Candidatus Woesebacteria bacterium RIFCSPLOWO2_01_FULL_38_20]